ncbi:MAG TPA: 2-succinyl-5-enolpyruvyl-6-hydroxy-3-cyclohexene-1-carboxylic-acid synthase [Haliangiales bacterium]|nr:2-succinyl-5-enolpyruvyl-6-hydroxy-3-cyclohexene-1-carboxylic-acid synthase [Haliangiales bacterium]
MNAWAWALIDAFADAGVTDVVASPGSRSTPFVLAAATNARLRLHDVLDERAAAFVALGQVRATGRPSLVLCTSGTAGAHHYPAVIEADAAFLPLLVLTADRPPELQGCGAPQTVDQVRLFGDHVRRFFAVPEEPLAARRVAAQALALALGPTPGPVHLNAHARKPLEPAPERSWPPLPRAFAPRTAPDPAAIEELARACLAARRGLLVCGPAPVAQAAARPAAHAVAALTGFPVVAEAASQLRFGQRRICDAFEWLSLPEPPDLIVQVAATPTSPALERVRAPRAILAPHGWPDPGGDATLIMRGDPRAALEALAERLGRVGPREPTAWATRLADANARAWRAVDADLATWGEGLATRLTVASLPPGALFAVGNSLPIRLVDAFVPADAADAPVLAQRGANGIDGLVAGAAGAALATRRPVTLLLGDVSFLHDVGGLLAARLVRDVPLVVVVLHNDGGRLFERLPIATSEHVAHFTTPHGLDLRPAAALAGSRYVEVADADSLAGALAAAQRAPGTTVVAAHVPPSGAAEQLRRIKERLA